MNPCLELVTSLVDRYGYPVLFWGIFLENFGIPFPGETLLIGAAVFAAKQHLGTGWIIALGFLATAIGSSAGYAIGYFGGRRFALRYGHYVFLDENRLGKLQSFFERYGSKIILASRFVAGLRQFSGIAAGIARMPWRTFFYYNLLGAALWVSFWAILASFLGNHLNRFHAHLKNIEHGFLLLLVAAIMIAYLWAKKNARHNRKPSPQAAGDPE